jgi:PAS domain S-box-containing protein
VVTHDRSQVTTIAGALSDAVVGARDGVIHSWNAGAEQLFGYSAEEVIGKPVAILDPADRQDELEVVLARLGRGEAIENLETVRRRKDGTEVEVSLSISPVRSPSGEIDGAAIVHDISARRHAEEIQGMLAEASRVLAVNLDYRVALSRVASLALEGLADWCVVDVETDGSLSEVAVAHRDPNRIEVVREMRRLYPTKAGRATIAHRVLTTGTAELVPVVSDALLRNIAQDDQHLHMLRELGLRSLLVVPMRARGRVLGTISLARVETSRRFGSEELELAEDIAQRAALTIDNANLYSAEKEARHQAERIAARIGRLQTVTAALSGALTPKAVAKVCLGPGAGAVGADAGIVWLVSVDDRKLELVAAAGFAKRAVRSRRSVPVTSALPSAEVFRTGSARFLESAAAIAAAAPALSTKGVEAIALLPLSVQGRTIGLIELCFAEKRTFDDNDRELVAAIADQCAQALERARLYTAERRARAKAERANERTARLQSLATELAETLTSEEVAEVVVRQGIASVEADAGALQLLSNDGSFLEAVCRQGADPLLVGEAWDRFSIGLSVASADAVNSREPIFIESERDIREHYPRLLEGQEGRRIRAGAHIPLLLSGRLLGVLFLGFSKPRTFSPSQRRFVLALASQCAQALGRAQLYEAELEERARLSRLIEALHEGIVSVDRGGRVEFANATARRMFVDVPIERGHLIPEAWLGFPLRDFVARLFDADRRLEAEVARSSVEGVFEVVGVPAAGSETVLLVLHDVSERERRRRAEHEFVANASHELRTPLAAIASAVERLRAGAQEDPERRDRFIGHIQRESGRLNRLTASLLVLARAQTHEEVPRHERIVLRELMEEVVRGLQFKPEVELILECPPDLCVSSNRDLLEHAVRNLASNAARHTSHGQVRISATADDEGSVVIHVVDTGVGIPASELSRLFDRFYRGPNEESSVGFGLGLPITKEAVEAIGGSIEIESIPGAGTSARIRLPSMTGLELT